MVDGVVKLHKPEPNAALVEMLTELIEEAKEGRVQAVMGVAHLAGGEFSEFFSCNFSDHAVMFLSYLRVLQMRVEREIDV